MIYAFNDADPSDNAFAAVNYHSANRGVKSIYLLEAAREAVALPDDVLTHDFSVEVSIVHSKYWRYVALIIMTPPNCLLVFSYIRSKSP